MSSPHFKLTDRGTSPELMKWQSCGRMDHTLQVLQEASCEALCSSQAKTTLQVMEGSSDSVNETECSVPKYFRFFQVFSGFARPRATASQTLGYCYIALFFCYITSWLSSLLESFLTTWFCQDMQSLEVNQRFLLGLKVVLISVAAALSASWLIRMPNPTYCTSQDNP